MISPRCFQSRPTSNHRPCFPLLGQGPLPCSTSTSLMPRGHALPLRLMTTTTCSLNSYGIGLWAWSGRRMRRAGINLAAKTTMMGCGWSSGQGALISFWIGWRSIKILFSRGTVPINSGAIAFAIRRNWKFWCSFGECFLVELGVLCSCLDRYRRFWVRSFRNIWCMIFLGLIWLVLLCAHLGNFGLVRIHFSTLC